MTAGVELRAVGAAEVDAVGALFASARTTRHCWCMSFCSSPVQFAAGWFSGGNRRRFQSMAAGGAPMGVVALVDEVLVGWTACGPRSRYRGTGPTDHRLLADRPRGEDDTTWLLPCLFVHPDRRGRGVSHALVEGAAGLANERGAVALEGWPTTSAAADADAFVGRQELFADLGFRYLDEPVPGRVIMRLDLDLDPGRGR